MLKRYDMKKILANADMRRWLITRSTVITMAREGIDISQEESERSYDKVVQEKRLDKTNPVE